MLRSGNTSNTAIAVAALAVIAVAAMLLLLRASRTQNFTTPGNSEAQYSGLRDSILGSSTPAAPK